VSNDVDADFYNRADAVIHLANSQLDGVGKGKVSASCMYGTARFNAWLCATGFNSAEEMQNAKAETIEYFVAKYREMFDEHYQDYVDNFAKYMQTES
jgi:hypothetical protein